MNIHEQYGRARKVTRMADLIWKNLGDHERTDVRLPVRMMEKGQAWRDAVAEHAGVRTPSAETWRALCGRIAELVDAERERTEAKPFSVFKPELGELDEEDVWECETCHGEGDTSCPECMGHHEVHGYSDAGSGYPVMRRHG